MTPFGRLLAVLVLSLIPVMSHAAPGGRLTIAAASDLHRAMDEVVTAYRHDHPAVSINVIYGASGALLTQIEQGAPFDIFFSADSDYPRQLVAFGQSGGQITPYGVGHLVLWSASLDMRGVRVADLAQPRFGRRCLGWPCLGHCG